MKFDYFDESKSISAQLSMLEKELAENPESVPINKRYVKQLLDYQNAHRLDQAMSHMSILLNNNPDVESKALYVRTLRLMKQTPKAKQNVSQYLQANPENPELLEEQGRIWADEGNYKDAKKNYLKVLKMAPTNQRVRRAMIELQRNTGESPDKILASARILVELEESDKNIQKLSNALKSNDKHKEAIKLLEDFRERSPEIFGNYMSTDKGQNVSLSVNLAGLYSSLAVLTANEKKLNFTYKFGKNHKVNFIIDTDDEVDELLHKSNELYDKIIFDENFLPTVTSELIFIQKANVLIMLRRFSECRYFLVKEKLTESYQYFYVLFYLKEFDKACSFMSHLVDQYPSSENYQKNLSDCFRAMGKIEDYRKHYAIYEKLKKEGLSETEDRPVKDKDENHNYSNITDQPVRNLTNHTAFYSSLTSKVLKIWNKYFAKDDIVFLQKYLNKNVKEIQVIRGIDPYKNGLDFYRKFVPLIDFIERFNLQNKNKCKISVRVVRMKSAHDRYILEKDHVWDILTIDQIKEDQTGENYEVTDPEGITNRREEFEELWNDDDAIEISAKNREIILLKLAKVVEDSGNEFLDEEIKYEIEPSKKFHNKDKAVRDKLEHILGEELRPTTSIRNLENSDFISKMHEKIKEELAEYIDAAQKIIEISEKKEKFGKHVQWLLENPSTSQKMIDVKNKKIKKIQNEIKNLEKKIENETHVNPLDELSDILEAVYRMAELNGSSAEELDEIRENRAEKYGRFSNNCYMIHDSEPS
ncbi:MAG: hypothetical protein HOG69_00390 [Thaumarchaeota archaeon]|nr:hypothetical protein [Nitrososphaerota archaeon]